MVKSKKERVSFICQACGFESPKWIGKCSECGAWNSMVEEKVQKKKSARSAELKDAAQTFPLAQIEFKQFARIQSQCEEFNRVLGGGIVPGSVVLVGGDPGIGKSTLMLQEGTRIAREDFRVLYITGEESSSQIKLRANRLGVDSDYMLVLAETDMDAIMNQVEKLQPNMLIIDSIQTIYTSNLESAPGSISQIRECAYQFITLAKSKHIPVFLIGHVTKEGYIAGPKVLEHIVDTLLYFEGDRDHFYRILRTVKNRFGSTNEIGVFEMSSKGLMEVRNPSQIFISERREDTSGSAIICALEGTRPILLEIQALVSPTSYGLPQRTASGVDAKRLSLLLAVLEKRVGLRVGTHDVFVNAVSGVRIDETAADLGTAVAIASSLKNQLVQPDTVIIGEIGLGGEIRAVSQIEKRISEAGKLGFKHAIIPASNKKSILGSNKIKLITVEKLVQAIDLLF